MRNTTQISHTSMESINIENEYHKTNDKTRDYKTSKLGEKMKLNLIDMHWCRKTKT